MDIGRQTFAMLSYAKAERQKILKSQGEPSRFNPLIGSNICQSAVIGPLQQIIRGTQQPKSRLN